MNAPVPADVGPEVQRIVQAHRQRVEELKARAMAAEKLHETLRDQIDFFERSIAASALVPAGSATAKRKEREDGDEVTMKALKTEQTEHAVISEPVDDGGATSASNSFQPTPTLVKDEIANLFNDSCNSAETTSMKTAKANPLAGGAASAGRKKADASRKAVQSTPASFWEIGGTPL